MFACIVVMNACRKIKTPTVPAGFTATYAITPYLSTTNTATATCTGTAGGSVWIHVTPTPPFNIRSQSVVLEYHNLMWLIAGSTTTMFNDVWESSDGVTWVQATGNAAFGTRYGHSGAVFTNTTAGPNPGVEKMWVMGGYNGSYYSDVWYSTDGITWTQATAAAASGYRADNRSVVYNGAIWVIAGSTTGGVKLNDVWSSTDGVTWSSATLNAAFSKRTMPSCVVYNGLMWLIGGSGVINPLNDVWYSSDGITWSLANGNAAFSPRYGHTSVVFDGRMWVLGGADAGGCKNDVWSSTDGVTWTQTVVTQPFLARAFHASIVHNNEMWVIAGINGVYINDIWHSQ